MASLLDEWLERLEGAESEAAAFAVAKSALEDVGLDRVIYLMAERRRRDVTVFSTMPAWWQEQYHHEALASSDPFLAHCCDTLATTPTGVEYLSSHGVLSDDERRFVAKGGDAGLRAGMAVPTSPRGGARIGGFNVGMNARKRELEALWRAKGATLRLGLLYTQQAFDRLRARRESALSTRERECLALLADGCQNKEIAHSLDIAPSTVELHLRNARRKLGAHTREHAVAIAVRRGLLDDP